MNFAVRGFALWILLSGCVAERPVPEGLGAQLETAGWRPGVAADCLADGCKQYLTEHPGFAPYHARVDVDRDGRLDDVKVFVKGDSGVLLWMSGDGSSVARAEEIARLDWARQGAIFADSAFIRFGKFDSDEVLTWQWSAKNNRLVVVPHHPDGAIQ